MSIRYKQIEPTGFRAGDIVPAELSFVFQAVPIKKKRYLIFLSLRAVAMISDGLRGSSEDRTFKTIQPNQATLSSPNRIKRKQRCVESGDEDETYTNRKRHNGQDGPSSYVDAVAEDEEYDTGANGGDTEMEEGEVTANKMEKLSIDATW